MSADIIKAIHYATSEPVAIEIEDGLIVSMQPANNIDPDLYVAPGLIDNQVNGYNGVGFAAKDLSTAGVKKVIAELCKQGVTTFLPTIITTSFERAKRNFEILGQVANDPQFGPSIPCFHLEGPYISDEEGYRGAHDKQWVRDPNWAEFCELNSAANGLIKHITLAPEKPGALEFIKMCVDNGILVGLGHFNADTQIIHKASKIGAQISTHLGNGCANKIHRHNNPIWPQLANDDLWASMIVDGFHLNEDEVKVFYKTKGADKLILISDITEMAGLPVGEYEWENQKIEVTKDGRLILKDKNIFAGASLPLHTGISNIMEFSGCSMADAVNMASRNPAKLNHLTDRGEITAGKRADLVLFKLFENNMNIIKTIVGGKVVFKEKQPFLIKNQLIK